MVQTCDLYANIFGLPGAALAGVPVRIGSRRELNPDKTAGPNPAAAAGLSVCHEGRREFGGGPGAFSQTEGLAPGSIAVIPNGVDAAALPGA